MKRLLFLTLVALCGLVEVHAIKYNVYVKNADGTPLKGVQVYSFNTKRGAEDAYKAALKLPGHFFEFSADLKRLKKDYALQEMVTTNEDGLCIVECDKDGYLVLDADDVQDADYEYAFSLFCIADYIEGENDFDIELVMQSKKKNKSKPTIGTDEKPVELRNVNVDAKKSVPQRGDAIAARHGENVLIRSEVDVSGEYARDDARFVAFPYIVFEDKDSIAYLPPAVIDGKGYGKSMERRMSFETSRDKLDEYHVETALHLQNHGYERFLYSQSVPIKKGTRYYVPAKLWFEDYNGVYQCDSLLFQDGKETEPLRFLDWSSVQQLATLDAQPYEKEAPNESFDDDASFHLDFEQGKAYLNMRDSLTKTQCDSMVNWLKGYSRNIKKIVVRGYSSPEGSERRNRELSHERAEEIRNLLAAKLNLKKDVIDFEFNENDNIITWQEVSDFMLTHMDDSVARHYARRISELIVGKSGFDSQNAVIYKDKALYDYVKTNVLNQMRVVEISATILVQRALTRDEIIERYEQDPAFRNNMALYQCYHVICYLADNERWKELYDVAKRTYEKNPRERSVTKQIIERDSTGTPVLRFKPNIRIPYPLAGYYYAVSMLRLGMSDVGILKPYLDDGGLNKRNEEGKYIRPQEMNGAPFVVAQIMMYCQREEFGAANELVAKYNLQSEASLKGLVMFVKCLAGYYQKDNEEETEVREYVMGTSPINKAVLNVALGKYEEALELLSKISGKDAMEESDKEYLKAICLFRLQGSIRTRLDCEDLPTEALYKESSDSLQINNLKNSTWAAPMLNAFSLDSNKVSILKDDGYFNNAYRQMLIYFWTRMQAGVPIDKVAEEYKALVSSIKAKSSKQ